MLQGYLLGSYMYLSIVFIVPLSLGVVAVALDLPLNNTEALEGLVMPASAYVLLGKGGQHPHRMLLSSPGTRQHSRHSVSGSRGHDQGAPGATRVPCDVCHACFCCSAKTPGAALTLFLVRGSPSQTWDANRLE